VQDCQPDQYVDRTAPSAIRQLAWNFGIVTDPTRCMQVKIGQTVTWVPDNPDGFSEHPLGVPGGDTSNPILFHDNGKVTFNTGGTFGYVCNVHSQMKGAIKVVQATTVAVPALSPTLAVVLIAFLLASGLFVAGRRSDRAVVEK
jgi:hypothetical protein